MTQIVGLVHQRENYNCMYPKFARSQGITRFGISRNKMEQQRELNVESRPDLLSYRLQDIKKAVYPEK